MGKKPLRLAVYKRCSSDKQDVMMQDHAIAQWIEAHPEYMVAREFVDEGVSAAAKVRPAFTRLLKAVDDGKVDVVLVWRFDRASRSTIQLLELLDHFKERNTHFVSIREAVDTTTPAGRLMFTLIAGLAEFERELIRERTKAGLAAAKAQGRVGGAKPKLTGEQRAEVRAALAAGVKQRELSERFGVSQAAISRIGGQRATRS